MFTAVVFLLLLCLVVLVHLSSRRKVRKLSRLPDHYPLSTLSQEPQGSEVFVTTADGTRLRVVTAGSGPTVVLAHGFLFTLQEWNVVWAMLLEKGHRVIAFDQRGHGKSTIGADGVGTGQMVGDYKAVLEHFGVEDGILVGHSMGGFLALAFLLGHPESTRKHLRGVILFAALVGNVLKGAPHNRLQIPLLEYGLIRRVMKSPTYGALFARSLMGDAPSPSMIRATLDLLLSQPVGPVLPILRAMIREDFSSRLGEIHLPVVVICGSADRTTPSWHSELLGKAIPGARDARVEGKGHLLNWEAPAALVDAVESLSGAKVSWPSKVVG